MPAPSKMLPKVSSYRALSSVDLPVVCSNCRKASSLWLEFSSADNRRLYYRCAACGHISEVDADPAAIRDPIGGTQKSPRRTPPWWTA